MTFLTTRPKGHSLPNNEGVKPTDQGAINRSTVGEIMLRNLAGEINNLLARRGKVHIGWWTDENTTADPDPSSLRVRLLTSPNGKLRARLVLGAVRSASTAEPDPRISLTIKDVATLQSITAPVYHHNLRDSFIGPSNFRQIEMDLPLPVGVSGGGRVLEVTLFQADKCQVVSCTIYEPVTNVLLDPATDTMVDPSAVIVAKPIYAVTLAQVYAGLRAVFEKQGCVLLAHCVTNSASGHATQSATDVNLVDPAFTVYAFNAPGFWCDPAFHGSFGDDGVTVVVWINYAVSNLNVSTEPAPVNAVWNQVTFATAFGAIGSAIGVQDTFQRKVGATDRTGVFVAKRMKWPSASALSGGVKIDVLWRILGTRPSTNTDTIYACGAYESEELDPRSISGLAVWLAADKITGLVDGAAVSSWSDASGNGNTAAQATGANQPVYKTGIISGMPVVRFDGVNDFLKIADSGTYKVTRLTVFIVSRTTVLNTNSKAMISYPHAVTHTSPFYRWALVPHSRPNFDVYSNGAITTGSAEVRGFVSSQLGPALLWSFDTRAAKVWKDGILFIDGADADQTYPNAVGICMGADNTGADPWGGDIAEVLVYNRQLTDTERQTVEVYLAEKYALVRK